MAEIGARPDAHAQPVTRLGGNGTEKRGELRAKSNVLLISHDVIGPSMAGPGIRYFNLARELAEQTNLSLALQESSNSLTSTRDALPFDVTLVPYRSRDWPTIESASRDADVIVMTSDIVQEFPQLAEVDAALVIDGYDPLMTEWLALFSDLPDDERHLAWQRRMVELHQQYLAGDFYICASQRQRYWWLGQLEAAGRLNPEVYRADPSLNSLIAIVPYGLRSDPPIHTGPAVRGVWPGIEEEDILILWGGGLWPWLDPLTAIHAVHQVRETRPDVKLLFPGTRHPNPILEGMPTHNEAAFATADALDLRDKGVFFGDWIAYDRWPSLLLECDIALSLHFDTVETQLAFRSRLFDTIWASLPTVVTCGDATSDLVTQHDLGLVVDYLDVDGVAAAILDLIDEQGSDRATARQSRFAAARAQLTWKQAAAPLVKFCQNPSRAPDRPKGYAAGTPFYTLQIERLQNEVDEAKTTIAALEDLVHRYESGRVMRAMQRVNRLRLPFMGNDDD